MVSTIYGDGRINKQTMDAMLIILPFMKEAQPSLGASYVAAYAQQHGHNVVVKDVSMEFFIELTEKEATDLYVNYRFQWFEPETYAKIIFPMIETHINRWAEEIAESDAEVVGFSVWVGNYATTLDVVKRVKERCPQKVIVVGGPHAAKFWHGQDLIKLPFIDHVVYGEGEITFCELLESLQSPTLVRGLLTKAGDTGERPLIKDLDDLPLPSLDHFRFDLFKSEIPILPCRGCVYNCAFCTERSFWKRFRTRSAENIFQEVEVRSNTVGSSFYFASDLINANIPILERLCDLIIQSRLPIAWAAQAAFRTEMSKELLSKMRRAGCFRLEYGMESASPKILREMNKNATVELASRIIKDTHDVGIEVMLYWIVGFPTETEADFQHNIKFIKDHADYLNYSGGWIARNVKELAIEGHSWLSGCGVVPGSDLYNNPEKYGIKWDGKVWRSSESTPEIRQRRCEELMDAYKTIRQRTKSWQRSPSEIQIKLL